MEEIVLCACMRVCGVHSFGTSCKTLLLLFVRVREALP